MRVALSGATGFLGSHLSKALLSAGHDLVAVARSFDRIHGALADCGAAIHLAAQTEVGRAKRDPVETFEGNVRGSWLFLEECRRASVKRVIVASSDKAYGAGPVPYIEGQALAPHGIYATSKACEDMIAHAYAMEYGMKIAVTRCGNLYGPGHLNFTTLIPDAIRSIIDGRAVRIRSDGTPRRDYLFIDDAVRAYITLLESDETGAFNFGTGVPTSALEIVKTIILLMGQGAYEVQGTAKGEIDDQWLDSRKARIALGWQSEVSLIEGLHRTIAWHRDFMRRENASMS